MPSLLRVTRGGVLRTETTSPETVSGLVSRPAEVLDSVKMLDSPGHVDGFRSPLYS